LDALLDSVGMAANPHHIRTFKAGSWLLQAPARVET
jgi:hypothetical protein